MATSSHGPRGGDGDTPDLHPTVLRAAGGTLPEWARAGEQRREHMARVADVLEVWARALELEPGNVLRWRSLGYLHDALRDAGVEELRSVVESAAAPGIEGPAGTAAATGTGERPRWSLDRHAFSLDRAFPSDHSGEGSPSAPSVDAGSTGESGHGAHGADLDAWAPIGGSLHGPAVAARLAGEGVEDREILSAVAYHTVGHPDLGTAGRALYCADFVEPGRPSDREWRAELRARYPEDPRGVLRDVLRCRIGYLLERGRPIFLGTARMWNRLHG